MTACDAEAYSNVNQSANSRWTYFDPPCLGGCRQFSSLHKESTR